MAFLLYSNALAQVSRFAPSAVRVGADPGTLFYAVFSETRGFFEVEADIDVGNFFVVTDYGISDYVLDEPTYYYKNTGTYFRVGADYNLMHTDPNNNIAFIGLRFSTSSFGDQLDFDTQAVIESETGWPNTRETFENSGMRATWFELVAGLKIRVVKQLYMGFTARYKFVLDVNGAKDLKPFYVPGFGKTSSDAAFGFNYYVSYRLPFRTKTVFTK